jgi:hypothetical protein
MPILSYIISIFIDMDNIENYGIDGSNIHQFNAFGYSWTIDIQGYFRANINNKTTRFHVFLWKTINGDIQKGYAIHHKDGNKLNNRIENLESIDFGIHSSHHMKGKNKGKTYEEIYGENKAKIVRQNVGNSRKYPVGVEHPRFGKHLSDDAKKAISAFHKGRYIGGNSPKASKIKCIETGEIFDCIKDAEYKYGINNISACCRGVRKSAGGLHWEYLISS